MKIPQVLATVAILLFTILLCRCCPSGCGCHIDSIVCQFVDRETVYRRNVLITTAKFTDSFVDVTKVISAYVNLKVISFHNCVVINCPETVSIMIIGACSNNGRVVPAEKNAVATAMPTSLTLDKVIDDDDFTSAVISSLNKIKKDNWIGIAVSLVGYSIVIMYWIFLFARKVRQQKKNRVINRNQIRRYGQQEGFDREEEERPRRPFTRSQARLARQQNAL